jgi:hypothetical protein
MATSAEWKTYEQVSAYLLERLRKEFGLAKVEGKQKLTGIESGAEWEVDAKGIQDDGEGIVIIECRRYTKSRQNQGKLASLAYSIKDTGAKGGIIVSQLGLQEGAKKVAKANNILSVIIDANSTPQNFAVAFLNKLFLGTVMNVGTIKMSATATLSKRCSICGKSFIVKDTESVCEACS